MLTRFVNTYIFLGRNPHSSTNNLYYKLKSMKQPERMIELDAERASELATALRDMLINIEGVKGKILTYCFD